MVHSSLFLYVFHRLVFPCSYLIGGTIPTSLLVLVETIFTPLLHELTQALPGFTGCVHVFVCGRVWCTCMLLLLGTGVCVKYVHPCACVCV